ncbi:shikimate kinase [Niallia nealsonii]|uniref:Shikimate kinase n=1 Tax=Niallia nealsonii TaxID=115979 RepID=A0A2N0Z298_9BACI|nr:shikimate kinase [Niallia nealsonii]PKG23643.1 shikimate kinase [Niallia nealsonii]
MGVGKTSIGKAVAKKLYRDFIDADQEIEKEYEMPVSKIFAQLGEKTFREKEKELIINLCKRKLHIISLGGGSFLQEEIKKACLENCIVIYLDLTWESWKERLHMIIDSRPVLQGKSIEEMEALFYERKQIYADHHSKVLTDQQEIEEVANYIVESLKLAWDLNDEK